MLGPFAVSITEENAGPHLRGETHTHAPGLPVAVSPTHSNLRESSPRSAPFAGHAARGILPFLHPRVVTSTVEYSDYARLLCPLLIESVAIGPFKPAYSLKVCTYIHTASLPARSTENYSASPPQLHSHAAATACARPRQPAGKHHRETPPRSASRGLAQPINHSSHRCLHKEWVVVSVHAPITRTLEHTTDGVCPPHNVHSNTRSPKSLRGAQPISYFQRCTSLPSTQPHHVLGDQECLITKKRPDC